MRRFVESEIRIKADAETILSAFVDVDKMKDWWGVDSGFIEKKDGGLYTITWLRSKHGIKFISTGRIKLFDRKSHLSLEDMLYLNSEKPILGPFTITYTVESHRGYSILKVKQTGFKKGEINEWYYHAVLDGWPEALIMVKKYLES